MLRKKKRKKKVKEMLREDMKQVVNTVGDHIRAKIAYRTISVFAVNVKVHTTHEVNVRI